MKYDLARIFFRAHGIAEYQAATMTRPALAERWLVASRYSALAVIEQQVRFKMEAQRAGSPGRNTNV